MNILIIYAHPNPKSFSHAILETVVESLKAKGDKTEIRDLYKEKFEPVLKSSDFIALKNGMPSTDIKKEQDFIKLAEKIIYIHPLWWLSVPAILKGYIDRVHSLGFAYAYKDNEVVPLLKGKQAIIFTCQGGIEEEYNKQGIYESIKKTFDYAVFGMCGIEVKDHKFFSGVPYVTDEIRKGYLEDVKRILAKY